MVNPVIVSGLSRFAASKFGKQSIKVVNESAISDTNADSLIELGKVAQVEAITVVDNTLTMHEATTEVLKYLNSLFVAWYLNAAAISTDTGRIKTVKLLEKLNPSKNVSFAAADRILSGLSSSGVSMASNDDLIGIGAPVYKLPVTNDDVQRIEVSTSMEADSSVATVTTTRNASDMTTVQNLSVGQMVTLSVSDGNASKDVNVSVRLVAIPTQPSLLKTILTWSQQDNRLKSRISAWRAGELSFWRDVVLMRDLFTERKRILMNDKSDLLESLLGRQRDSMLASVISLTPSVGTMSSILVISSDTLRHIEQTELNGRLRDFRVRQNIMKNTGLMVIAVVDPLSEFVTVYTHTQSIAAEYSIKQLKGANKSGGSDLSEIIKLMNQNQMPNF